MKFKPNFDSFQVRRRRVPRRSGAEFRSTARDSSCKDRPRCSSLHPKSFRDTRTPCRPGKTGWATTNLLSLYLFSALTVFFSVHLNRDAASIYLALQLGSGCSTAVEHTLRDREVVGSNHTRCWAFFSSLSFSVSVSLSISDVSLIRSLTEVHYYWFS